MMEIDLHGYHPDEIAHGELLEKIVEQAWEMGERRLCLIHGHGRNRGISPGLANTNTGYTSVSGFVMRCATRR
jgi:DNA-nicking Smr family endonuclease